MVRNLLRSEWRFTGGRGCQENTSRASARHPPSAPQVCCGGEPQTSGLRATSLDCGTIGLLDHVLEASQHAHLRLCVSRLRGSILQLASEWILDALLCRASWDLFLLDLHQAEKREEAGAARAQPAAGLPTVRVTSPQMNADVGSSPTLTLTAEADAPAPSKSIAATAIRNDGRSRLTRSIQYTAARHNGSPRRRDSR